MVISLRKMFLGLIISGKKRSKDVEELFTASCHGDVDRVAELIEAGVNIRTEDEAALRLAAWWGCKEVAALLMDNGADPRVKNDEALRWAKQRGHEGTAEIIEQHIRTLKQPTKQPSPQSPE